MSNEIKQIMLDRSQGTQLESKKNAPKLYSVKEICEKTGLTRKQLYDYKELVQPTSHDKSGYKLYDDKALMKLICVAQLRSIDTPLAEIQRVIYGKSNRDTVIMDQINVLEERKKIIIEMIAKARGMLNSN